MQTLDEKIQAARANVPKEAEVFFELGVHFLKTFDRIEKRLDQIANKP